MGTDKESETGLPKLPSADGVSDLGDGMVAVRDSRGDDRPGADTASWDDNSGVTEKSSSALLAPVTMTTVQTSIVEVLVTLVDGYDPVNKEPHTTALIYTVEGMPLVQIDTRDSKEDATAVGLLAEGMSFLDIDKD